MDCIIKFKDGNTALVSNLKEVCTSDWSLKVEQFTKFKLVHGVTYTFVGDNSLKTLGADILYINIE